MESGSSWDIGVDVISLLEALRLNMKHWAVTKSIHLVFTKGAHIQRDYAIA